MYVTILNSNREMLLFAIIRLLVLAIRIGIIRVVLLAAGTVRIMVGGSLRSGSGGVVGVSPEEGSVGIVRPCLQLIEKLQL